MHTAGAPVRGADALKGPRPPAAEASAAQYYRADTRFSAEVDGRRIADALERDAWTAPPALEAVAELLFAGAARPPAPGMDTLEAPRT
ncbi:hypothetical protein FZ103_06980 [Streptomonospora sp. PA3]|uniref:hypothetical protein n=1 Tax=Streptomonospora sp. PA3 TaxID=2607326 RepID=UPI0012DFACC2|nr:hypothetical protein [Streptomonospora sp. PA3]MUL40931.1 hypothetical protein [Streptomonospora sp. PA3]